MDAEERAAEVKQLIAEHAARLRHYLAKRIPRRFRSMISPDDMLQEVWVEALAAREIRAPGYWLTRVARNKLLDAVRAARAQKRFGDSSASAEEWRRVPVYKTPSGELSTEEAREAVRGALAHLPEEQREVLRRHYLENASLREIARIVHKTETAVNDLRSRGFVTLRGCLAPLCAVAGARGLDDAHLAALGLG